MVSQIKSFFEPYCYDLGNVNDDLDFQYGEGTKASWGCGTTFKGEFWYFGGTGDGFRQVNELWRNYN